MKKLSFLLFALCVFLPATAFADLAPLPTKCEAWCVPKCYNCETQVRSDSHECFEPCYGCSSTQIREMCNQYMSELEAQRAKEQAALAAEAERQAQEAAAAQQTKPLETKRSCSALPYAPSQAPLALLIFCLIALGLAIPARRQK